MGVLDFRRYHQAALLDQAKCWQMSSTYKQWTRIEGTTTQGPTATMLGIPLTQQIYTTPILTREKATSVA